MFPPADRTSNLVIWAVLVGAAVVLQVAALAWSRLVGLIAVLVVLRHWRATRLLVVVGWGWLGWHLFVRTGI